MLAVYMAPYLSTWNRVDVGIKVYHGLSALTIASAEGFLFGASLVTSAVPIGNSALQGRSVLEG